MLQQSAMLLKLALSVQQQLALLTKWTWGNHIVKIQLVPSKISNQNNKKARVHF